MFNVDQCCIGNLIDYGDIEIPFFQRRYVWNEENWGELLDNLFDNLLIENGSIFLGSIILQTQENPAGITKVSLIDGQQRLTTISILLVSMLNSLDSETKEYYKPLIRPILFLSRSAKDGEEARIKHSRLDKDDYEKVINIDDNESIDVENSSLIMECYRFFITKLKNKRTTDIEEVLKKLYNHRVPILATISITSEADEQQVFDTLNTGGVRLSTADTIKNNLFSKLRKLCSDDLEYVTSLYEKYWEDVFSYDDEIDKLWNQEFKNGRITMSNIEQFLYCYAVIEGFYNPNDHKIQDLSKRYKERIKNIDDKESFEELLESLKEYAIIYKEKMLIVDEDDIKTYEKQKVLSRLLFILDSLESKTLYPYILHLLKKYHNNTDKINLKIHEIEKMVVINFLTKNGKSKNYNKLVPDLIKNEERIEKETKETYTDEELELGLQGITNKHAKFLLYIIETYRRKDGDHDSELSNHEVYQLEHIMPKKWEEHWNDFPTTNDEGKVLETKEQKIAYKNKKINCLGNMTLLTGTLNKKLKNDSFASKVEGKNKMQGYNKCSSLTITRKDVIENVYNKDKEWDEKEITNRTKLLLQEIKKSLLY